MESHNLIAFSCSNPLVAVQAPLWHLKQNGDRFLGFSQPLQLDGPLHILMTGKLYRYPSLNLDNCSDLQVVAHCYREYGKNFPRHLDGDCVIILYDSSNDEFFIVQSRFPTQPIFYYFDGKLFAVANDMVTLCKLLPIDKRPNLYKQLLYVGGHYRHVESCERATFFANIFRLEHASLLHFVNNQVTIDHYWHLDLLRLDHKQPEEIAKEYRQLLEDSIALRLARSASPAFTISSGMDSSSVVALASRLLNKKLPLYTTVFPEATEYNEAEQIIPVAQKFASRWYQVPVDGSRIYDTLMEILPHLDAPFPTITQLLHYYVAEQVSANGHDSLFSGLGGDEANSGEIEEYLFFFADLKALGQEERLEREIGGWKKYHSHPLYPKSREILEQFWQQYIDFSVPGRNWLQAERFWRYMPVFQHWFVDKYLRLPQLAYPYSSYLLNKLYQDLFCETIPGLLYAEAFNARKFSLTMCMPYIDSAVMQYGFSIPVRHKYSDGKSKAPLRMAMAGILPQETLSNFYKKGWNAPFDKWLKRNLLPYLQEILEQPGCRQKEIYDLAYIQKLIDQHRCGSENHMMFFWQFFSYEWWYRAHFGD